MLGDRKDAKVFEDIKRLEKIVPRRGAKIRESAKPKPKTCWSWSRGQSAPKQPAAGKTRQQGYGIYAAAGQLRLALGQKYAERRGASNTATSGCCG